MLSPRLVFLGPNLNTAYTNRRFSRSASSGILHAAMAAFNLEDEICPARVLLLELCTVQWFRLSPQTERYHLAPLRVRHGKCM